MDADGNIYERINGEWVKVAGIEDLHGEMQVNGELVKVYRYRCDLPSSNPSSSTLRRS